MADGRPIEDWQGRAERAEQLTTEAQARYESADRDRAELSAKLARAKEALAVAAEAITYVVEGRTPAPKKHLRAALTRIKELTGSDTSKP